MKYIDRKGNITIEENEQDKFLRHLYNDWGGRLCLRILVQPFVTKLGGWFLNTRFSAGMVPGFVQRNGIDLSVCTRDSFRSYNDFFTRRLKDGQRPIAEDESVLVSPCDGKVTVSRIGSDSRFFIKDTPYTLERLLGNKKLTERYLCPDPSPDCRRLSSLLLSGRRNEITGSGDSWGFPHSEPGCQ